MAAFFKKGGKLLVVKLGGEECESLTVPTNTILLSTARARASSVSGVRTGTQAGRSEQALEAVGSY